MTAKILAILLALSLFTVTGCGSDDDTDRSTIPQGEEESPENTEDQADLRDFDTRLEPQLAISGRRCDGGEMTEDPEHPNEECERDEWLVTVDNDNTCTDNGVCTEIFVYPFVADLVRTDARSSEQYNYFEIQPESPTEADEREALERVWVRADEETGETTVIRRN